MKKKVTFGPLLPSVASADSTSVEDISGDGADSGNMAANNHSDDAKDQQEPEVSQQQHQPELPPLPPLDATIIDIPRVPMILQSKVWYSDAEIKVFRLQTQEDTFMTTIRQLVHKKILKQQKRKDKEKKDRKKEEEGSDPLAALGLFENDEDGDDDGDDKSTGKDRKGGKEGGNVDQQEDPLCAALGFQFEDDGNGRNEKRANASRDSKTEDENTSWKEVAVIKDLDDDEEDIEERVSQIMNSGNQNIISFLEQGEEGGTDHELSASLSASFSKIMGASFKIDDEADGDENNHGQEDDERQRPSVHEQSMMENVNIMIFNKLVEIDVYETEEEIEQRVDMIMMMPRHQIREFLQQPIRHFHHNVDGTTTSVDDSNVDTNKNDSGRYYNQERNELEVKAEGHYNWLIDCVDEWYDIPKDIQRLLGVLGYNMHYWNDYVIPASIENKLWNDLTRIQKEAAFNLGSTKQTWNNMRYSTGGSDVWRRN